MIHIEAFHAPCCGGSAAAMTELRLARLLRDVHQQTGGRVKVTMHTLAFGDPASLEAMLALKTCLRASGFQEVAEAGAFAILGILPAICVDGRVRFVRVVPEVSQLLETIGNVPVEGVVRDESDH